MQQLQLRRSGGIGTITICNEARKNAMTLSMWRDFAAMTGECGSDDSVRVICIEGSGSEAFISGSDMSEFESERSNPELQARYAAAVDAAMKAPLSSSKPVLAKIRGLCIGGGVGIAAACDVRICAEGTRFRLPVARLGIGYGLTPLKRLVGIMGEQNAADVLFSARTFDAQDALRFGLVNMVSPPPDLDAACTRWLEAVSQNAPLTMRAIKTAMAELRDHPQCPDEARIAAGVAACFASSDYKEGLLAAAEKRAPRFRGR